MDIDSTNIQKVDPEDVEDIAGAEHVEPLWGERFRGWYLRKGTENIPFYRTLPLGFNGEEYQFKICEYTFQFIMPPVLTFDSGTILYTKAERLLGLFRFPTDAEGRYHAPVNLNPDKLMRLTLEEIKDLIKEKRVITFEAWRIPQFAFEFFYMESSDFSAIEKKTSSDFVKGLKEQYESELLKKMEEVRGRIEAIPDTLLILINVLNLHQRNLKEVELVTNKIIKDGI